MKYKITTVTFAGSYLLAINTPAVCFEHKIPFLADIKSTFVEGRWIGKTFRKTLDLLGLTL